MSKKNTSDAVKKKTAFVCAGVFGGPIFHAEAVTGNNEEAVSQLLRAGLRWAEEEAPSSSKKKPSSLRKRAQESTAEGSKQTSPLQAFAFLQGVVSESMYHSSPANAASSGSDLELLKNLGKEERDHYNALEAAEKRVVLEKMRAARAHSSSTPLRFRVLDANIPMDIKRKILQKFDRQQDSMSSSDMVKYATWVEAMLAVPLYKLIVPVETPCTDIAAELRRAAAHLERVVYGHQAAKQAMLERLYLWLKHPLVPQRPLALKGCPGNGKTSLVREGLAVIMNRPFNFMAMGGSFDSSFLLGHSYTYEGSTQGRMADALVSSACMNPILFFDEIDKCSSTPKGEEVVNVLVHVTDTTQSSHFRDRYLNGVDLDVSKALMVFAFNDATKVSSVLLDRFQVVQTDVFTSASQGLILKNYLLPRILQEHGLRRDFLVLSEDAVKEASLHCVEGGVRDVRSALEQVVCKACILHETGGDESLLFPLNKGDLRQVSHGRFELKRGIGRILVEGRGGAESRIPPGMYS
jgi:ATP-dependent Lon protease